MKFRIRPRMIAGFLVMSGMLVIVCMLTAFFTDRIQRSTARILRENVASLKAAEELEIALLDMKGLTANYLLDGQQKWLEIFENKKISFLQWIEKARADAHNVEGEKIIDRIRIFFFSYLDFQKNVVQLYQQGRAKDAHNVLVNDMIQMFDKIYEKCEELLALNEKLMNGTGRLIEQDNKTISRIIFGLGILGIAMGLAMGVFLARGITHSIYELVLKVRGATNNEIVEKVDITNENELEHLDKHIKKLIEKVHEVNKDLERSQRMLIRAEKLAALGRVSAGLAHEIRNPLTAIKMLIFTLQNETIKNDKIIKDFDVILKEIERIENFIQKFLDFARPPEPNFRIININDLLKQILNLLSGQITRANVRLIERFDAINPIVYGDKEQLQIVFLNVILNAIQSTNGNGIVTVESKIPNNQMGSTPIVQIVISDNGVGIPMDIIDNIFDPFVSGREGGIGLGLSIASQLVHNHGGWIEAFNNLDRGATFSIKLPIREKIE